MTDGQAFDVLTRLRIHICVEYEHLNTDGELP